MISNQSKLIILIGVVAGLFLPLFSIGQANATHLYTGLRWPTTTGGPFCIDNSMGYLNIGYSAAGNAISTAANYINGFPTHWTLIRIANNGDCHSHWYSSSFALDKLAVTQWTYYTSSHRFVKEDTLVNRNIKWTSSGCVDGQYPLRLAYLGVHEFTHWLQLKHDSIDHPLNDASYYAYRCSFWNHWGSHNQNTAGSVYG
jgi:hypothetical protein